MKIRIEYLCLMMPQMQIMFRIVEQGHVTKIIQKEMLALKRPGHGIQPIDFNKVIGKTAKSDVPEGSVLLFGLNDGQKDWESNNKSRPFSNLARHGYGSVVYFN